MAIDLHTIRKEYGKKGLSVDTCSKLPLVQLTSWMEEAIKSKIMDPTAMVVSTVNANNRPSSRVVLLKSVCDDGLIFFTNYNSRKGKEVSINSYISCNIFWCELERQIRVEGKVLKLSNEDSDKYFATRPYLSKIGVWASKQSDLLENRVILDNKVTNFCNKFGLEVPRPDFWGGYKILPDYFEFWQGRPNRLHDRIVYKLVSNNNWDIFRLYP